MIGYNPLKSLRIVNYYSYLLALGGTLLIVSILYEPKIINQSKLVLLCIITILYGLVEWIREEQFMQEVGQLEMDWQVFWDEQPMKGLGEFQDPNYRANLRQEFAQGRNVEKLVPRHYRNTWIILGIYLIIMVTVYLI